MLLIAQPKSASTSLAYSIGEIAKLKIQYGIPKKENDKDCNDYLEMQKYYSNMVQRKDLFLKQILTGRKTIFKEHLLPIREHLDILEKYKKRVVILIRNPEESIDSYVRFLKENNAKQKLNYRKMLENLWKFHNTYMFWKSNKAYALIVEYRDLVLNFQYEIKRILKHFQLKIPINIGRYKLAKKKFTGIGLKKYVIDSTA